jgi:hypothetical protein
VATAARRAACLHVNRAVRAACRRDGLTSRAGSAGGPKPGRDRCYLELARRVRFTGRAARILWNKSDFRSCVGRSLASTSAQSNCDNYAGTIKARIFKRNDSKGGTWPGSDGARVHYSAPWIRASSGRARDLPRYIALESGGRNSVGDPNYVACYL